MTAGTRSLRIEIERKIPESDALRRAWNNLVSRTERPEVFYTYEWAMAVRHAYKSRFEPLLVLGYEGETLEGVASLAVDRQEHDQVVFLAATTADYCDLLSASERREQWIAAVLGELRGEGFDNITLANLPADSKSVAAITHARRSHGYRCFARHAYVCAQIVIGKDAEREALRKTITSKKMLRRNLRALDKRGSLLMSTETRWEDIEPVLARFSTAHVARFLATGRISNIADPQRREFLRLLAEQLSREGWIALSRLLLNDRSVAWNYGFQYAGSWFWYQPTFDSRYEEFSPGYCLLAKMVESACGDEALGRVDLGLGAEGYKERFANSGRETLHVALRSSFGEHFREMCRYWLAVLARKTPGVEICARRAVQVAKSLQTRIRRDGVCLFVRYLGPRTWHRWFGKDKVLFFEDPGRKMQVAAAEEELTLEPLTLEILAQAAMRYFGDSDTLTYLLRSAGRLRKRAGQGFALLRQDGVPVHFAWVSSFNEFYMAELRRTLATPRQEAKLIFDCWTPHLVRGRGYYHQTLGKLVTKLRVAGHSAWIFSAAGNPGSLKGIQKTSFQYRFTLGRRRWFGFSRDCDPVPEVPALAEQPVRMTGRSAESA